MYVVNHQIGSIGVALRRDERLNVRIRWRRVCLDPSSARYHACLPQRIASNYELLVTGGVLCSPFLAYSLEEISPGYRERKMQWWRQGFLILVCCCALSARDFWSHTHTRGRRNISKTSQSINAQRSHQRASHENTTKIMQGSK